MEMKLGTDAFNVFVRNIKAVHFFLQIVVFNVNKPEQTSSQADSLMEKSLY